MEMEQGSHEESMEGNLAELRQLFGPPPVLRSESTQSYDEIMTRLIEGFAPRLHSTDIYQRVGGLHVGDGALHPP
jgi:hypothetical protein